MMSYLARNQTRLIRYLFILGVLVFAFILGAGAARFNPIYALIASIAPFVVVGLEIVVRRFEWFPIYILFSALFIPFGLPTGTGSRLVASLLVTMILVAIWVVRMLALDRKIKLVDHPINRPLFAFIIITFISLIWGTVFRDPFVIIWASFPFVQTASAIVMVMLPLALLIVLNTIQDTKIIKVLVIFMVVAGVLALPKLYLNINLPVNTGGMFNMWVINFAYAMILFDQKLKPHFRIGLFVLILAYIYYSFFQNVDWLAGWLPGVIALGVLTVMRSKKLTLLFGLLGIVFFIYKYESYFKDVIAEEFEISGVTRFDAWRANWRITREHLLFGTGPAGYAVYYMTYFPTGAMATHSNYIDILSQIGLTGFASLLVLFGILVVRGFKLCRLWKGKGDFLEAAINASFAGTIACLVIMGFGDWLFPFAYTQTIEGYSYAVYNWLFIGFIPLLEKSLFSQG
jgi:hypothetical protein